MKKTFQKIKREVVLEFPSDKGTQMLLGIILFLAAFVRVWRTDKVLGFYYDQGRDAQVIWDFLHKGKLFLIGPTTGIEGIFRGPWYYWLITPFYWLGRGDPTWPAVFLALSTVSALFVLFHLTYLCSGKISAFIAVIVGSFSFFFVVSARWLSNPTPMFLISTLLVYSLFLIMKNKRWAWVPVGFLLGMGMQFGSATEVFLFPAIFVFALWQRRNLPTVKIFLLSAGLLFLTFAPQIWFDFKHEHILWSAVKKFLMGEGSFKLSFWEVARIRWKFYQDVFGSKLFPSTGQYRGWFLAIFAAGLVLFSKSLVKNKYFLCSVLIFVSPLLGMVFFQGNNGNVYDYYFTGYYFIFVLIFSVVVSSPARYWWGKILLIFFLFAFLRDNLPITKNYINDNLDGPNTIAFGNEKQALDWVYRDMGGCRPFNDDEYVPPVIPHSYKYLFTWYGGEVHNCVPVDERTSILYTLYEEDPPHPERLQAWMDRQKGIGTVGATTRFGGITVERRHRL